MSPAPLTPAQARRESQAARKRRAAKILSRLEEEYPHSRTALHFSTPLELLVATILSAQCTDRRVNEVTPGLFRRLPTARHYARVPQEELQELIRPTGFFRNKARSLQALGQALTEEHGGEVPASMEALTALPGVGRKTANVVLGNAFGIPGIVVDTHVSRVSRRLFLSEEKDAQKIEQDLMDLVPEQEWILLSHRLIDHGRRICKARRPLCSDCLLADLCPSAEV